MVFPLLAIMAAGGLAAGFGRDYLERTAEEEQQANLARRYREALASARTETGGVGPFGPELPTVGFNPYEAGMNLLEMGDPAGLNLVLQGQQTQASTAAAGAQSAERMALEQYRQGQQNMRLQAELAQRQELARIEQQRGLMPKWANTFSSEWNQLSDEGQTLQYGSRILNDFRESLAEYGTETWSATAGRLGAQRQQLMLMLKDMQKTGAIDEGTLNVFEQMLPDPTAWSGDLTGAESGRLEATAELWNSFVRRYNARKAAGVNLPDVPYLPTRLRPPEGTVPVTEIGSDVTPPQPVAPSGPVSAYGTELLGP